MRNLIGLSSRQIEACQLAWELLGGNSTCPLDVSRADIHNSLTHYSEPTQCVALGADVYPGGGTQARSRLSLLGCLAHELAHAKRHQMGFGRTDALPGKLLDEAETSLHASFELVLSPNDRCVLVEDAHDQVSSWLATECGGAATV